MKPIWHQIYYDFLGFRLLFLIWVGLLLARTFRLANPGRAAAIPEPNALEMYATLELYGFGIVLLLIGRNAPAATGAFLHTRPIGRMELAAAKVLWIFLFLLVPYGIHLGVTLAFQGLNIAELAPMALETSSTILFLTGFLFVFAALSPGPARALLLIAGILLLLQVMPNFSSEYSAIPSSRTALNIVQALGLFGFGILAYRIRRYRMAYLGGILLLLTTVSPALQKGLAGIPDTDCTLHAELESLGQDDRITEVTRKGPVHYQTATLKLTDPEHPEMVHYPLRFSGSVRLDDGSKVKVMHQQYPPATFHGPTVATQIQAALGPDVRLLNNQLTFEQFVNARYGIHAAAIPDQPWTDEIQSTWKVYNSPQARFEYPLFQPKQALPADRKIASLDLTVVIQSSRYEILGKIPMEDGTRLKNGSRWFELRSGKKEDQYLLYLHWVNHRSIDSNQYQFPLLVLYVDTKRSEAMSVFTALRDTDSHAYQIHYETHRFEPPRKWKENRPDWREVSELWLLELRLKEYQVCPLTL